MTDERTMVLEAAKNFVSEAASVTEGWWSRPDLVAYHVFDQAGRFLGNIEWFEPGKPTWTWPHEIEL